MGNEAAGQRSTVRLRVKFTLTQTLSRQGRGFYTELSGDSRLVKRAGAGASQYAPVAARLASAAYPPAMLYHMDMELIYFGGRDLLLKQAMRLLYRHLGIN